MDLNLDEWDFLSDDGFLDFSEDSHTHNKLFLSKPHVFDADYFTPKGVESPRNLRLPDQLLPVPIPIQVPSVTLQKNADVEADQDSVSQVFFKKKENEFVDMKMDSPKSGGSRGEALEIMTSPRIKENHDSTWEHIKDDDDDDDGFNLWKWGFTGIGAICSFGVAAATVCILFFGSQHRNKLNHNHKIRFQIYADDQVPIIFFIYLNCMCV